jgi:translation initiation factor 2B subunit (eIF-2B alpha/beta/delta family)
MLGEKGIPAILISDAAVFAMMPMITKVMLSISNISNSLYISQWWADCV